MLNKKRKYLVVEDHNGFTADRMVRSGKQIIKLINDLLGATDLEYVTVENTYDEIDIICKIKYKGMREHCPETVLLVYWLR